MSLDHAVAELIRNTPGANHGGRVFLGLVPESQPLPAVSYMRTGQGAASESLGKSRLIETDYQIRALGNNASEAAALADSLEQVFTDYRGEAGGVRILGAALKNRFPDWASAPGYHAEILKITIYRKGL